MSTTKTKPRPGTKTTPPPTAEPGTDPKLSDGADDYWPPLAHIANIPIKEGDRALCGAKLMGIELPNATKVCEKCIEIQKREMGL